VYLKLVQLPDLVAKNKELAHTLKDLHGLLTTVLLWMVILHVAAAFKHHFLDRDGLLWRMWFAAPRHR
jgi:cytochrome b561